MFCINTHLFTKLLFLFILFTNITKAQTDTLWFNSNGTSANKDTLFYTFNNQVQFIDGKGYNNANQYYLDGKLRKEILTPNTTISFNYRTLKTNYYDKQGNYRTVIEHGINGINEKEKIYLDHHQKEIGRSSIKNYTGLEGKRITYYVDDILTIKEIKEVFSDTLTTTTLYYKNGNIAIQLIERPKEKYEVFYDTNNQQIGKLHYVKDRYWKKYHGKEIDYNEYQSFIEGYSIYKNGKVVETQHDEADDMPGYFMVIHGDSTIQYYDVNGQIVDTFSIINGIKNGTTYLYPYEKVTYRNNRKIASIKYAYTIGGLIQSELKHNKKTYYSLEGDILGEVTLSDKGLWETQV